MSRPVCFPASRTAAAGGVASDAWYKPDLLATRLAALAASETEIRGIVSELGACPYRSGHLGAAAPVLPSPDELVYAARVLARALACVEHALGNVRTEAAAAICA